MFCAPLATSLAFVTCFTDFGAVTFIPKDHLLQVRVEKYKLAKRSEFESRLTMLESRVKEIPQVKQLTNMPMSVPDCSMSSSDFLAMKV